MTHDATSAAAEQTGPPTSGPRPYPDVLDVGRDHAATRTFYDRISGIYDLLSERTEEPLRRAGLEALAARAGEHLLEVGVGTGHCLVDLAEATGPSGLVVGMDLSPRMLHRSRHSLDGMPFRATTPGGAVSKGAAWAQLVGGDAVAMPYAESSFDGIFMSFVLELFDNPEIPAVLRECRRVLRPGGRLVVVGLSKEDPGWRVSILEWAHAHFPHLMDCRPIYVRKSLEQAGFEIETDRHEQVWVPVEIIRARRALGLTEHPTEHIPEFAERIFAEEKGERHVGVDSRTCLQS